MLYLYLKTHNVTGLKYLGKTNNPDPHKYLGSGTYWRRHLNKHGKNFHTQILLATDNKDEIRDTGIFFSRLWNIIESKEFANHQEEKGDGVSSHFARNENYRRLSNGTHPFCNKDHNAKIKEKRNATIKKNKSHNFLGGELQKQRVADRTHHLLSGEIQRRSSQKLARENKLWVQNFRMVVDIYGVKHQVQVNEYDPNSKEYAHINSLEGKKRLGKSTQKTDKQLKYLAAKLVCPHCNKNGNVSNMKRWHFDNCKCRLI